MACLSTGPRTAREFFHTVGDNRSQLHHLLAQFCVFRNVVLNAIAIGLQFSAERLKLTDEIVNFGALRMTLRPRARARGRAREIIEEFPLGSTIDCALCPEKNWRASMPIAGDDPAPPASLRRPDREQ